ncbi:MAG: TrkH family potassium uptake protein [Parvularcula sp.]|jgi:trk system potassium uptake protein TrkH|nr:TrkH family potassium uptake protein [Parvularcula sp.]
MYDLFPVARVLGWLLIILGGCLLVPLATDLLAAGRDWPAVALAVFACLAMGSLCAAFGHEAGEFSLDRRQAFLCTASAWVILPAFAAVPFLGIGLGPVDAYFEAVSGFTTTGSTVVSGLDALPPGILLWRSFLQWLGGIGIIVMALLLMPFMRVGGMQLFKTESSDTSDKVLTHAADTVRYICGLYLGLSALCALTYGLFGMSGFDALNHAMTTISTGGYSTHDASFGYFGSPWLRWAGIVFMLLGAIPFVVYIRALTSSRMNLGADAQVRAFLVFLALVSIGLGLWHAAAQDLPFGVALTDAAFNVISVVTTTGYATTDYTLWGAPAISAFFLLTFIGGCSGSTSGGIKIYRFQILFKLILSHLRHLVSPSRVDPISYNQRRIDADVMLSVLSFLIIFLVTVALVALALGLMGLDLITALTAAATAVANVGPGLGSVIGPAGNFSSLPDAAKLILTFAMIAGRLEFFTLMVMLTGAFWVR